MDHFISCHKTVDVVNIATFLKKFDYVVVRQATTSICNAKFINYFWKVMWKKFDTSLNYSSVYHPHRDG